MTGRLCCRLISRVRTMYTSDIENRRHRSLLEHRRIGICKSPMFMLQKIEFARGGVCGGRKMTAVNSNVKTRFFLKTGCRQQLTRQLITFRVQVIASTFPHSPHTSAANFTEMWICLQPWHKANVYTVTRSPGRPPASSSSAAALERMRPVASDHRGRSAGWMDMVMRPSQRRGVVAVGGLMCCRASECHPAPASIMTRRRPSLHGWSRGRWFQEQSRHTFEQREYRQPVESCHHAARD